MRDIRLTDLQTAVDALVKRGSDAEVLAAQKAPLVAEVARLDRELANLTAAIASGQRPDVVLAAIAEREAAKKKAAAEVSRIEKLERAARDFDAGAAENKLRSELKTWRDLLERDPSHARTALRQILDGPIEAEYSSASDVSSSAGRRRSAAFSRRLWTYQCRWRPPTSFVSSGLTRRSRLANCLSPGRVDSSMHDPAFRSAWRALHAGSAAETADSFANFRRAKAHVPPG